MRVPQSQIMDASAIVGLFRGFSDLEDLLDEVERGQLSLLLPTTAMADAEAEVRAGTEGWEAVLLTPGIRSLPLTEHAAIEVGPWPGSLASRHAVHEAQAVRAVIVTRRPGEYEGLRTSLVVV